MTMELTYTLLYFLHARTENLFDVKEVENHWRDLLGLSSHNSWECVGETSETRLAFRACLAAGMGGAAMDMFKDEVLTKEVDWKSMLERLDKVHDNKHNIPESIFAAVSPFM